MHRERAVSRPFLAFTLCYDDLILPERERLRDLLLKEYVAFRRRLQEELAVAPTPETQTLAEAIRRDRPAPKLEKDGMAESSTGEIGQGAIFPLRRQALALPFVGRSAELEQLANWWGQATRGAGILPMIAALDLPPFWLAVEGTTTWVAEPDPRLLSQEVIPCLTKNRGGKAPA